MNIRVFDLDDEMIFEGEAEDFLEVNDYDSEIEYALNELDRKRVGDSVKIRGNQSDCFEIEKIEAELIY